MFTPEEIEMIKERDISIHREGDGYRVDCVGGNCEARMCPLYDLSGNDTDDFLIDHGLRFTNDSLYWSACAKIINYYKSSKAFINKFNENLKLQ